VTWEEDVVVSFRIRLALSTLCSITASAGVFGCATQSDLEATAGKQSDVPECPTGLRHHRIRHTEWCAAKDRGDRGQLNTAKRL